MLRIDCDVLVIGGGGAGLMAACAAARSRARVAVVSKGKAQRSGATIMAPGAIAAVDERWLSPGDSRETHLLDTLRGGAFLNDRKMVSAMVDQAPDLVLELERMGAIFQREEDGRRYALRIDGGHSFPRCPFLEDRTGREMMKALAGTASRLHIPLYENIMITRLLKQGDCICGAAGLQLGNGEQALFECRAVILATGGAGAIYANTDNPADLSGDGYALALQAGAALRDMEFVQFYPLGFLSPPSLRGMLAGLLYYCRLRNSRGERFMEKYDPERLELSTRDLVSRAILQEVRAGNASPAGGVYLDLTFNAPGYIAKMTPSLYATYRNLGLDPEKDLLEVAPTAHFFMGGMEVDASWQSRVPGLFGAGEVCGGMHGGNRLSQNALAEILVSGLIAGKNAASLAAGTAKRRLSPKETLPEKQRLRDILKIKTGIAPLEAINALKKLMWEYAGVIRSGRSLERAVSGLAELAARPVKISGKSLLMNREVAEVLELGSMLASARCVVLSALERKESRAAHFREDYPEADNETRPQTIIIQGYGDRLATERRPAETPNETPGDPERIAAENIRSVPREFICESLPQACRKTDSLLRKTAILSAKNLVPPDKILVSRFDPETDREPYWKEYAVAVERGMTVLDLLLRIREEQDPTLAHSYCCRNVCCGLCGLTVNGTSALACRRAAEPGMRLAPLAAFPVLRDLVVQRDSYEQLRPALRLFPERTDRAEREPESIDMAAFDNFKSASRCVECLCCVSSCPVYLKDRHNFAGPAALILEARHYFDPRDRLDRAQILKSAGLGLCTGCGRCTEVCALGVDPAALIGKMKLSTGLSRPLSPQKN